MIFMAVTGIVGPFEEFEIGLADHPELRQRLEVNYLLPELGAVKKDEHLLIEFLGLEQSE